MRIGGKTYKQWHRMQSTGAIGASDEAGRLLSPVPELSASECLKPRTTSPVESLSGVPVAKPMKRKVPLSRPICEEHVSLLGQSEAGKRPTSSTWTTEELLDSHGPELLEAYENPEIDFLDYVMALTSEEPTSC